MSVIGVPIKVLHEAEGHIVTVETTTGEVRVWMCLETCMSLDTVWIHLSYI